MNTHLRTSHAHEISRNITERLRYPTGEQDLVARPRRSRQNDARARLRTAAFASCLVLDPAAGPVGNSGKAIGCEPRS